MVKLWYHDYGIIYAARPYIAEVDMLMATVELAKLLPCRLPLADIVIDPHSPTRVQLASTWCQWLEQLLQNKIWFCGTSIWSGLTSWLELRTFSRENLPFWLISLFIFTWNLATELSGAPPGLYLALAAFNRGTQVSHGYDMCLHCLEIPAKECSRCRTKPSVQHRVLRCRNCR